MVMEINYTHKPGECKQHWYAESIEEREDILRKQRRSGSPHNRLWLQCVKCGSLGKWTPSRPRKKAPSPKATVEDRDGPTGPCAPMFGLLF